MLVHVHVGGLYMTLFLAVYFYSLVVHVPTCYMYIAQITLNQLAAFTVILAKLKLHEACVCTCTVHNIVLSSS